LKGNFVKFEGKLGEVGKNHIFCLLLVISEMVLDRGLVTIEHLQQTTYFLLASKLSHAITWIHCLRFARILCTRRF